MMMMMIINRFLKNALSGQLSKSQNLRPLITVILASTKLSPLLSGRGHPLLSPNELFLLSWPSGHFVSERIPLKYSNK